MVTICQYFFCLLNRSFERGGRIRIGVTEVERGEGVGRGLIGLIRLWKCVENSKHAPFDEPNPKGMRHPKTFQHVKVGPPACGSPLESGSCGLFQRADGGDGTSLPEVDRSLSSRLREEAQETDKRVSGGAAGHYGISGNVRPTRQATVQSQKLTACEGHLVPAYVPSGGAEIETM